MVSSPPDAPVFNDGLEFIDFGWPGAPDLHKSNETDAEATSVSSITFCPAGHKPIDTYPDNFSEINVSVVAYGFRQWYVRAACTALPASKRSSNWCLLYSCQNPAGPYSRENHIRQAFAIPAAFPDRLASLNS